MIMRRLGWPLPSFLIAALLAAPSALARWGEPTKVLTLENPSKEIRTLVDFQLDVKNFYLETMTPGGDFVFGNHIYPEAITILTQRGDLVRQIPCPRPYWEFRELLWPFSVRTLGKTGNLLVDCSGNDIYWMIFTPSGHLVRMFMARSAEYNVYVYEDGRFLIWTADRGTRRLPYYDEHQGMWRQRTFLLYDSEGNLLEVLNNPPDELGLGTQASGLAPFAFTFPNNAFLYFPKRPVDLWPVEGILHLPKKMPNGEFAGYDGAKFPLNSFPSIYDKEGRLLGYSDGCAIIHRQHLNERGFGCSSDWVMDQHKNLFFAVNSVSTPYTIYKQEWVDGPGEPIEVSGFDRQYPIPSDPPATVPLDGFFRPLDVSPLSTNSFSLTAETGQTLKFEFQEEKLLVGKKPFPVYDLMQHGLALYQKQNPLAILGAIPKKRRERLAQSQVVLDFSETEKGWIKFQRPVKVTMGGSSTWTLKNFALEAKPHHVNSVELPGYDQVSYIDRKEHEEIMLCFLAGQRIAFHPERPDTLYAHHGAVDQYVSMFETGADTRVFTQAALQNRVSVAPKALDPKVRSILQLYCVQWPLGPSTLELKETEAGSRRFASGDGKIVYELAFVMDEQKNLVEKPDGVTLNYLFFYVTDSSLKLDHAPQIMYETGVDTGEYHSWYEVKPEDVNPAVWEKKKKEEPGSTMVYPGNSGEWITKPWRQVEKELPLSRFTISVSGEVAPGSVVRVSWGEPGQGTLHHNVPLQKQADGTWKTTVPLLCFTADGLDIGGTWRETEDLPTPQIPGALTFREKNVKWEIVTGP